MATVAHHVYSHYTPEDRERLELETGQLDAEAVLSDDPWATEKAFGSSSRITHPPMFVPATLNYDEWAEISDAGKGVVLEGSIRRRGDEGEGKGKGGIAGWYRSLARKTSTPSGTPGSSTPVTETSTPDEDSPRTKRSIRRDRNKWFISRALEASSSSNASETSRVASPATLADILARDPPPLSSQEKYTPPVWLAIGPSNKGFTMLQKSGWKEGEALGRASRNRAGLGYSRKGKGREADHCEDLERDDVVKREVIDNISMNKEIIDLTGEESGSDSDSEDVFTHPPSPPPPSPPEPPQAFHLETANDLDHAPRALLTPLPTVLKSDRLGIGLKAKTVGSGLYRAPVKRVTHSQAAVAAHIRANEERRRLKEKVGRGRRGYERIKKREEDRRRNLLAYLNR